MIDNRLSVSSCPKCHAIIDISFEACSTCGLHLEPLKKTCSRCKARYICGAGFCSYCKNPLPTPELNEAEELYTKASYWEAFKRLSKVKNIVEIVREHPENEWIIDLVDRLPLVHPNNVAHIKKTIEFIKRIMPTGKFFDIKKRIESRYLRWQPLSHIRDIIKIDSQYLIQKGLLVFLAISYLITTNEWARHNLINLGGNYHLIFLSKYYLYILVLGLIFCIVPWPSKKVTIVLSFCLLLTAHVYIIALLVSDYPSIAFISSIFAFFTGLGVAFYSYEEKPLFLWSVNSLSIGLLISFLANNIGFRDLIASLGWASNRNDFLSSKFPTSIDGGTSISVFLILSIAVASIILVYPQKDING